MYRIAKLILSVSVVVLVGCGTTPNRQYLHTISAAINAGRCEDAKSILRANERDQGKRDMLLAVIAHDCERNDNAAMYYLQQSARRGNQDAVDRLLKLGAQVPPNDLERQDAQDKANAKDGFDVFTKSLKDAACTLDKTQCEGYKKLTCTRDFRGNMTCE